MPLENGEIATQIYIEGECCHKKIGVVLSQSRRYQRLPQNVEREYSPATLISEIWPPELGDDKLLWFKPLSLWLFVMAASGN